jgi:hypothetical protein
MTEVVDPLIEIGDRIDAGRELRPSEARWLATEVDRLRAEVEDLREHWYRDRDRALAAELERDAARMQVWNRNHPTGTPVRIWPGARPEGRHIDTETTSLAWMLGGSPVVLTAGHPGGVALTHVQVLNARNEHEEGTDG